MLIQNCPILVSKRLLINDWILFMNIYLAKFLTTKTKKLPLKLISQNRKASSIPTLIKLIMICPGNRLKTLNLTICLFFRKVINLSPKNKFCSSRSVKKPCLKHIWMLNQQGKVWRISRILLLVKGNLLRLN